MNGPSDLARAMIFLIPIVATFSLFLFLAVVGWAKERRREREAFYRHETARKLVEQNQMSAADFAAFVEEERIAQLRARREGLKLTGLVLLFCGAAFLVGFVSVEEQVVRGMGFIPFLIGAAILAYVFLLGPRIPKQKPS
jgi:hypothetical protein